MDFFDRNILSIITFWPLAGMLVLLLIPKESTTLMKWWANIVAVTGFLVSLPLWLSFNFDDPQMQKVDSVPWIQSLGVNFHVGVDGISRSEEHTSELQSQSNLVCRLLLEKKKKKNK